MLKLLARQITFTIFARKSVIFYMAKKEINYTAAMKQLEEIVNRMESDELDIDSLGKELKSAKELIKVCRDKLTKTEEEIQKILEQEKD